MLFVKQELQTPCVDAATGPLVAWYCASNWERAVILFVVSCLLAVASLLRWGGGVRATGQLLRFGGHKRGLPQGSSMCSPE